MFVKDGAIYLKADGFYLGVIIMSMVLVCSLTINALQMDDLQQCETQLQTELDREW